MPRPYTIRVSREHLLSALTVPDRKIALRNLEPVPSTTLDLIPKASLSVEDEPETFTITRWHDGKGPSLRITRDATQEQQHVPRGEYVTLTFNQNTH